MSFRTVFFNALLATLNSRDKLARLEVNDSSSDLHVYHPPKPLRVIKSGLRSKIASVLPLPSSVLHKGEKRDPTAFGSLGRWEADIGTNSNDSENAYPMPGMKKNEKVSRVVILLLSMHDFIVLTRYFHLLLLMIIEFGSDRIGHNNTY